MLSIDVLAGTLRQICKLWIVLIGLGKQSRFMSFVLSLKVVSRKGCWSVLPRSFALTSLLSNREELNKQKVVFTGFFNLMVSDAA